MPDSEFIPLSEPVFSGNEWHYLKDCLDSGYISSVGAYVERFEVAICRMLQIPFGVACINGTAALHVALLSAGVQPGDEVIVPSITFVAPANAVRYCGAEPVFMDCEPAQLCMDVSKLATFLDTHGETGADGTCSNRLTQKPIRAIVPVHVFGHPAEMDTIAALARRYHLRVVEDATESLGSRYRGRHAGTIGDIGCLSFNGNKIITAGGGGMILTRDPETAALARHLTTQAKRPGVDYDHDRVGFNYRLSNLHAAVGLAQLEALPRVLAAKRANARYYRERLKGIDGVEMLWEREDAVESNFWFYGLKIQSGGRQRLLQGLKNENIEARPLWKPLHTLPMYRSAQSFRICEAPKAYASVINFPCSAGLTPPQMDRVCSAIAANR